MKKTIGILLVLALHCSTSQAQHKVTSTVDSSDIQNVVLKQSVIIKAPLQRVWDAYTVEEEWAKWATPLVNIDLRNGGNIKTNYNKQGEMGDATTNTLKVIHFIPLKMLTLQADIRKNFPEFSQEEQQNMYGLTFFEAISETETQLTAYGLGYKNTPKFKKLIGFFIKGNEWSYGQLKNYLENGVVAEFNY